MSPRRRRGSEGKGAGEREEYVQGDALADGPDEVHRMVVGRNELKPYMTQAMESVNATFRDG